jgi:hypothetical protein
MVAQEQLEAPEVLVAQERWVPLVVRVVRALQELSDMRAELLLLIQQAL